MSDLVSTMQRYVYSTLDFQILSKKLTGTFPIGESGLTGTFPMSCVPVDGMMTPPGRGVSAGRRCRVPDVWEDGVR